MTEGFQTCPKCGEPHGFLVNADKVPIHFLGKPVLACPAMRDDPFIVAPDAFSGNIYEHSPGVNPHGADK